MSPRLIFEQTKISPTLHLKKSFQQYQRGQIRSSMEASRITLREFELSDADDVLIWAGDDRVTSSGNMNSLASKEEALSFIEQKCIPHPWWRGRGAETTGVARTLDMR